MPVLTKLFHTHERAHGDEDFYSVAHDTDTGRVFVQHEKSQRRGYRFETTNEQIELAEFLARGGTAQDKLLALIATLATEKPDA